MTATETSSSTLDKDELALLDVSDGHQDPVAGRVELAREGRLAAA